MTGIAAHHCRITNQTVFPARSRPYLGLSIAKLIIERIGGTIAFEEMRQGARCVIEVPVSEPATDRRG